ncbi:MAG: hypothetical protein AAB875_04215 [Patescibacteria group bacterium]
MKNYKKFKLQVVKGKKEYYQVFIFNDRMNMRLFSMELLKRLKVDKMEAATHSFKAYRTVDDKEVESDMIGAILFYKGGFGHGVVSHEIAHAVNYYFLRKKIGFNLAKANDAWVGADETYATILGYMVNQFWKKHNGKVGKERY